MEVWKNIKGYEKLYKISNLGNVKSLLFNKEKQLKPGLAKNGYLTVMLFKNKKGKTYTIHRLVAENFIENRKKYKCINHKDGNKLNNNANNLEWCDYSHNNKEAYKMGLKKPYWQNKKGKYNYSSKKVIQLDKNYNVVKIWDCLADTERIGNYNFRCVSNCCLNKQKYHKGFIWKYETI